MCLLSGPIFKWWNMKNIKDYAAYFWILKNNFGFSLSCGYK